MPDQISSLHRRQFLQGMGVALCLPTLHSSAAERSPAQHPPRRLVCVGNHLGFYPANFFPSVAGKDFQFTPTLQPLEKYRNQLTVFSHLDHDLNGGHKAVQGFLTSIKKEEADGFPDKNISLDQMAAEHVGNATRFASLTTGIGGGTDMSWARAGVRIPPTNHPATLFRGLFVDSPRHERQANRARLTHRASVLDALSESAHALHRTLNVADRNKLDQYLTSVRDVERRLQMSQAWIDRPKPKSPIDEIKDEERQHIDEIALLYDLMALALQTDSTRVTTLEVPMGFRTAELDLGSYHGLSHHSKSEERLGQLQIVEAFLTTKLRDFMTRLQEAQILDDTLIVFGSGMSDGSIHSNRNLPVLLAGGGLAHQGHVICPAEPHRRIPLSNLWLSILHWFGSDAQRFGRSTGTFSSMAIG